jgi:EpsI family protein
MLVRSLVAAGLVVAAGIYGAGASEPEQVPPRVPLVEAPREVGGFHGHDAPAWDDDVVEQLGVDDYINRQYVAADGMPVAVYIGYYESQRQGSTIHSPQNCLPGAGWHPVLSERATIHAGGRELPVNRFIIQKGMDRQAVYYWYQGRGRVVANEFANKGWLMLDAARLRRSDGGLVRLMTPIDTAPDAAFARLDAFTGAFLPHLSVHLP